MNNLPKIKQLKAQSQKFLSGPSQLSILLVGSAARNKDLGISSDIDLIIYSPNNFVDFENYKLLNNFRMAVEKLFHKPASLQIITPDDLELIFASSLLASYINDGVMVYGKDLKEIFRKYYKKFSPREKMLSSFKRILFERYHFRANLAKFTVSKNKIANSAEILLSKKAMFIIKDLEKILKTSSQEAFKIISLKSEIPKIPILPEDFKDKNKIHVINDFIDQLVSSLKVYLEKQGPIKLNVW